jgi:hypothetical protein
MSTSQSWCVVSLRNLHMHVSQADTDHEPHYTSPEIEQYIEQYIEQRFNEPEEVESDVIDDNVAKHVDYTGCAFIERMLIQQATS